MYGCRRENVQTVPARMGFEIGSGAAYLSEVQIPILEPRTDGEEVMSTQNKRTFSEEHRKKLSEARKGRIITEETRRKLSISNSVKRKPRPKETREKLSIALKGRPSPHRGISHSDISRKHMSEAHIGKQCGELHPNWQGGISFEPYCQKFTDEFKERVRAFFGYQCQECGYVWQPNEKKLAVHHVNYKKDACCSSDITPLFVPVCPNGCHAKTNHNRIFWEYWFTEMINRLYGGKCFFTKEEFTKYRESQGDKA
jgi:hypothetical protein